MNTTTIPYGNGTMTYGPPRWSVGVVVGGIRYGLRWREAGEPVMFTWSSINGVGVTMRCFWLALEMGVVR